MTHCEAIREDLPGYLSLELEPERVREVESHLASCADCNRVASELQEAAALASSAPLEFIPPTQLEEEVLTLVGLEPGIEGRAPAGPAGGHGLRSLVAPGLAAALLVLSFLGAGWRLQLSDTEARMRRFQESFGPLGEPVQSVAFGGPGEEAADAKGQLLRQPDGNHRLVVRAEGLPATAAGYHYEVWLTGSQGTVSACSFKVATADDRPLSCPLGVSPSAYPNLWITLEPDDGNPRRQGPTLLEARLGG